jgi:hypothetical protein
VLLKHLKVTDEFASSNAIEVAAKETPAAAITEIELEPMLNRVTS